EEKDQRHKTTDMKLSTSPNPFTTSTTIHLLGIGHSAEGKELKIYNITGRLVKKLSLPTAYSQLPTGVTWDGRDNEGREVQGGVYFLKVGGECVGKVVKVR
ncbi:T9SS type A sorting domain-containing protein, partial [candidate division WOR-3 bacterium]|nr:T9SS type A sorting domain-containing protein [candidate division WOR-3 bacterium]